MELDVRHSEASAFIHVRGDLDLATSARLYGALEAARADGATAMCVDLSGVDFVDSPGLSVLLRWQDEAASRGESFSVRGARGLVRRVLRETGTERMLEA